MGFEYSRKHVNTEDGRDRPSMRVDHFFPDGCDFVLTALRHGADEREVSPVVLLQKAEHDVNQLTHRGRHLQR